VGLRVLKIHSRDLYSRLRRVDTRDSPEEQVEGKKSIQSNTCTKSKLRARRAFNQTHAPKAGV
jgi:hypothetical protein